MGLLVQVQLSGVLVQVQLCGVLGAGAVAGTQSVSRVKCSIQLSVEIISCFDHF